MAKPSTVMSGVSNEVPVDTQAIIRNVHAAVLRTERVLKPSFGKHFMGEGHRDRERAVVSAALEQTRAGRKHLSDFRQKCEDTARIEQIDVARHEALSGLCSRIILRLDEWRDWAFKFQDNEINSKSMLLEKSTKMHGLITSSFPGIDLASNVKRKRFLGLF